MIAASVYAEILVHPLKRGSDRAIDDFLTAHAAEADFLTLDQRLQKLARRTSA